MAPPIRHRPLARRPPPRNSLVVGQGPVIRPVAHHCRQHVPPTLTRPPTPWPPSPKPTRSCVQWRREFWTTTNDSSKRTSGCAETRTPSRIVFVNRSSPSSARLLCQLQRLPE